MNAYKYREPVKSQVRVIYKKCKTLLFLWKEKQLHWQDKTAAAKYGKRISNVIQYNKSKNYPESFSEKGSGRVAVYTCIFGNYDAVKPIGCKSKYCDYYIITDQAVDEKSGWKKLAVAFPEELQDASPVLRNRYCKMHPHILFPEYDYSIYMDGSIVIYADIFPLLGRMGEKILGMYAHSSRDCIYQEAAKVVELGKAPKNIVDAQMSVYRQEGFPEHFGLTDGIVIARKHNEPRCVQLMQDWWKLFCAYSKRDQLGLMYAVWKNGMAYSDIALLGANYQEDVRLKFAGHRK